MKVWGEGEDQKIQHTLTEENSLQQNYHEAQAN